MAPEPLWAECQAFKCSGPSCLFAVDILLKPSEFKDDWVGLLTNVDSIEARLAASKETHPSIFPPTYPSPTPKKALNDLRSYLQDALRDAAEGNPPKTINPTNKRFVASFGANGEACRGMLADLGFEKQVLVPNIFHLAGGC